MLHFIIINLFGWSCVYIWNRFRVRLNWKILRLNLNITIINNMMINSPYGSWNHRTGFGKRGPGFKVSWCRLYFPLSWCISWFITMKCVKFIHIYSKTWWGSFKSTDDSGIILVSNSSTAFANTLLYHAGRFNNWLDSLCIIVSERWRNKIIRSLTWSGKCSLG